MKDLFIPPEFQLPEHAELSLYIIDRSKELFFDGGINNIFSDTAAQKSIDYFNIIKKPVNILSTHYGVSDRRVEQITTLFVRVAGTYYYNLFESFATSTLSSKEFSNLAKTVNIHYYLGIAPRFLNELKMFATNLNSKSFIAQIEEYRLQCIFNLQSISLGIDTPIRFKPKSEIVSKSTKKEGCYIATMVYKSYDAPQVIELRHFRDSKLEPYILGRLFIKIYYIISPILVKYLNPYSKIHPLIKRLLSVTFNLKS